jgi:type I restriction enzyme, S subunit
MSDELPQGWAKATLGQLTETPKQDIISGPFGSNLRSEEYVEAGVPIIRLQNVDRNRFLEKNIRFITPEKARELSAHTFQAGDIVVTKLGAPLGKACVVPESLQHGIVVADVVRVRIDESRVSKYYVLYAINSPAVVNQINSETMGSTRPRVNLNNIRDLEIPLAPLAEQCRIVTKLEKLLAKLDVSRERLGRIPAMLNRFRHSVLTDACSGRLTVDWRELLAPNSEQATSNRDADLPEIPREWRWVKLPETGDMTRGKSRHRPRNEPSLFGGPYPFIQTGDIAQSGGRITTHKQTYNDAGLAQSRLWPAGTICITIAANIAESAILTYPACFPDSVVGIIANPKVAVGEYVEFFMRVAKSDLATFAPATAQKNINIAILNEVQVPLPPLREQVEIVRRVESLFALADRLETRFAEAQRRIDGITQSILAKAFRGKLLPTEFELAKAEGRSFESAEQLLDRIRPNRSHDRQKGTFSRHQPTSQKRLALNRSKQLSK